jgi:hypothetical protein
MNTLRRSFNAALLFLFVNLHGVLAADSYPKAATSAWIPIADTDVKPATQEVNEPSAGRSYISIRLLGAVMRTDDGWWTKFISTNENVGIVAKITPVAGGQETLAYSSMQPVLDNRNFEFSVNKPILEEQPVGRRDITVKLQLISTADDGAAQMLNDLKSALPTVGVAITSEVNAGVALGKKVMDAIFKRTLKKEGLTSDYGTHELKSGIYVIFAGKDGNAYARFRSENLRWRGQSLRYVSNEMENNVDKVSYIVLKVTYQKRLYPDVESVKSAEAPWAKHYVEAERTISPIAIMLPTKDNFERAVRQLEEMGEKLTILVTKGAALVDEDKSLTAEERENIGRTMMPAYIQDRLATEHNRLSKLLEDYKKAAVAATTQKASDGTATITVNNNATRVKPEEVIKHVDSQKVPLKKASDVGKSISRAIRF